MINRTGDLLVTNLLKKNAFCSSYEFVLQNKIFQDNTRVKHSKSKIIAKALKAEKLQKLVVHVLQLSRFDWEACAPIQCIHILFCEESTSHPSCFFYLFTPILFSFYLFSVITT